MPGDAEFTRALASLSDHVDAVGDSVVGRLDDVAGGAPGESDTAGLVCERGGSRYVVAGGPDAQFFAVVYPNSVVGSIASTLDERAVAELLGDRDAGRSDGDGQPEAGDDPSPNWTGRPAPTPKRLAAREWLDSLDGEVRREMRFHLTDRLSDPAVEYGVFPESGEAVYGFQVERKVFPYDGALALAEFDRTVRAVVSVGANGHNLLARMFDVEEELPGGSFPLWDEAGPSLGTSDEG